MKERKTVSVSISFTDENAIRRIKKVYEEGGYSHSAIYMLGIQCIEDKLNIDKT